MLLAKDNPSDHFVIKGYQDHALQINDFLMEQSVIITGEHLANWMVKKTAEITPLDWQIAIDYHAEIILLGTGDRLVFPTAEQLDRIYRARIGVEVMTTPAACRTFSVLRAEQRQVVAMLIVS